jgi:hypothetical protein
MDERCHTGLAAPTQASTTKIKLALRRRTQGRKAGSLPQQTDASKRVKPTPRSSIGPDREEEHTPPKTQTKCYSPNNQSIKIISPLQIKIDKTKYYTLFQMLGLWRS